jgi:hypothetical protein
MRKPQRCRGRRPAASALPPSLVVRLRTQKRRECPPEVASRLSGRTVAAPSSSSTPLSLPLPKEELLGPKGAYNPLSGGSLGACEKWRRARDVRRGLAQCACRAALLVPSNCDPRELVQLQSSPSPLVATLGVALIFRTRYPRESLERSGARQSARFSGCEVDETETRPRPFALPEGANRSSADMGQPHTLA